MTAWHTLWHAACVTCALALPGAAFAQTTSAPPGLDGRDAEKEDPDGLLRQGVELRKTGHDAEALDVFKRAYALQPMARQRAQIGLAEQALGVWVRAEEDLMAAGGERDDGWLIRNAAALDDALETVRVHLAAVQIQTNVAGAQLWIDGLPRGSLPLLKPLRVVAGKQTIEVRAAGYEPVIQSVQMPPGSEFDETISLHPVEPSMVPAQVEVPTAPMLGLRTPPRRSSPSDASADLKQTLAWAFLGGGLAVVAAGAALQVAAATNASTYDDDKRCLFGDLSRDERCGAFRDRAEVDHALAVTGISLGAASFLASVIVFATTSRHSRTANVRCKGFAGIASCSVTF